MHTRKHTHTHIYVPSYWADFLRHRGNLDTLRKSHYYNIFCNYRSSTVRGLVASTAGYDSI